MNERIKELIQMADLCGACLMASGATEEEIQNRSKVVLANLIVRECAEVSLQSSHRDDDMGAIIARHIKKHFGVEE